MRYVATYDQRPVSAPTVQPKMLKQYMEQLFLQPYWTRVWIIQEVVLAQKLWILYDQEIAPWEDLVQAFDRICQVDANSFFPHLGAVEETEGCRRFTRIKQARASLYTDRDDLHELVELFKEATCMDPRDKMYGLRGIAKNGKVLKVEYGKSPAEVFFDGLSLMAPAVRRVTARSLQEQNSHLLHGLVLCTCLAVSEEDFVNTLLQDASSQCLHVWLTYHGEVVSSSPVYAAQPINSTEKCSYYRVKVKTWSSEQHETYYSRPLRLTLKPGDKVYGLTTPEDADEESSEPLAPFLIVFRDERPFSEAIDQLITPGRMWELRNLEKAVVDRRLGELCYDWPATKVPRTVTPRKHEHGLWRKAKTDEARDFQERKGTAMPPCCQE